MKLLLGLVGLVAAGVLVTTAMADSQSRFLITGSSTVAPILQLASERIEAEHPGLLIDVQTGGSSRGIQDARAGSVDAGMASRDLTPEEAAGLHVVPLAYDGVALIANTANPLTSITTEQVADLYLDRVNDWSAFGGSGPVTVVHKAEGRATLEVFLKHFGFDNKAIQADVIVGDNAQGVRMVANDPNAIGYVSIGEALHAVENGEPIRLLALDGVEATLETVADGTFPVRRTLYIMFPESTGASETLLDYLRGPAGRRIMDELSFVPAATGTP